MHTCIHTAYPKHLGNLTYTHTYVYTYSLFKGGEGDWVILNTDTLEYIHTAYSDTLEYIHTAYSDTL
jgi:hypothetical protein